MIQVQPPSGLFFFVPGEHRLNVGEWPCAQGRHVDVHDQVDREEIGDDNVNCVEHPDAADGCYRSVKVRDVGEEYSGDDDDGRERELDADVRDLLEDVEFLFRSRGTGV